ncbi:MAG: EscU/YscU/HrcU family type III secretion system export apparatus switch protein [Oscillospiraceae bacterium]|jgi:flagellar biosynthesis protein|nr:EscU/YscU/HrcU family type III secretion system export apparatus switch protein [Oscillospiraceae bacterium]
MNKKHKTAAVLKYDPEKDGAPILTAFGEGYIADKIVEVAHETGVPVVPDAPLAALLSRISVGDEIPEELYEVVAKILIFVSELDGSYAEKIANYLK